MADRTSELLVTASLMGWNSSASDECRLTDASSMNRSHWMSRVSVVRILGVVRIRKRQKLKIEY